MMRSGPHESPDSGRDDRGGSAAAAVWTFDESVVGVRVTPAMSRSAVSRPRSPSLVAGCAAGSQSTTAPSAKSAARSRNGCLWSTPYLLSEAEEGRGCGDSRGVPRRLVKRLGHLLVAQPHFQTRDNQVALVLLQ